MAISPVAKDTGRSVANQKHKIFHNDLEHELSLMVNFQELGKLLTRQENLYGESRLPLTRLIQHTSGRLNYQRNDNEHMKRLTRLVQDSILELGVVGSTQA
jgi:hypothetical protein